MSNNIRVAILPCQRASACSHRTVGEGTHTFHTDLGDVDSQALSHRAPGICVLIRPNFNEKNDRGDFYREWRSFDGGTFTEIHWYFKEAGNLPISFEVQDGDLLGRLPTVPI